jgi:hypothetical protein
MSDIRVDESWIIAWLGLGAFLELEMVWFLKPDVGLKADKTI